MHILVVKDDGALQSGLQIVWNAPAIGPRFWATACWPTSGCSRKPSISSCSIWACRDGLTVLRRLRRLRLREPTLPVLILSARDRTQDRVHGLDAGADGYLDTPFERAEFEARVRALLRRGRGALLELGGLRWLSAAQQGRIDGVDMSLTKNEAALLDAVRQARGRVLSKAVLATRCGADDRSASDNSVEVYIYRLRRKLELAGLQIKTVRGLGYLLQVLLAAASAADPR